MKDSDPIDISGMPEVIRLVDKATSSDEPVALRRGDEVVAEIVPVIGPSGRLRKRRTAEGRAAFRAAAGSWKDVDTEKFLERVYERRRLSTKPPVEL